MTDSHCAAIDLEDPASVSGRADQDRFTSRFSDATTLLNHPFFRWFQAPH